MSFALQEKNGKIEIQTSENWQSFLLGSRSEKCQITPRKTHFFVKQSNGILMPIKRFSQFEDRSQKNRVYPMNALVEEMQKKVGSFIEIRFKPIPEKLRKRALKKMNKPFFKLQSKFDQWESHAWFSMKLRRFLGPPLRKLLRSTQIPKTPNTVTMESMHEREDPLKAATDKLSRPLFQVEIHLSHPFKKFFQGFSLPYLGELSISKKNSQIVLSAEELASLFNLPHPKTCAVFLDLESSSFLPVPIQNPLSMPEEDRKRHIYILGKTGMGKSTLLKTLIKEDINKDWPIALFDPHGDLVENTLKLIPPHREKDILLLDATDTDFPISINPVECTDDNPNLKASNLLEIFRVLSQGSWGPRLEYILRNAILTLTLTPNTTLLDLPRLLTNKTFCLQKIRHLNDSELLRFWLEEFLPLDEKTKQEHISSILNKVGPLILSPLSRNIFGQPRSKFSFQQAFKENKIILVPLSKGLLGEDLSRTLGMVLISMLQSTFFQRAALPLHERKTVSIFIDEFQSFATLTLLSLLSESRKYGLALTLANQYLSQLLPEIEESVLGNVGSFFTFRSCFKDAQILAPSLNLTEEDIAELEPFKAYAKLLHKGRLLPLFRMDIQKPNTYKQIDIQKLKAQSRIHLARRRNLVEEKIQNRYNRSIAKTPA